jgi:hypothetical protein
VAEEIPITARRLVLPAPADAAIDVQRDIEVPGADGLPIALDLYRPDASPSPAPVIVIAIGYPGRAGETRGGRFKDLLFVQDWARWFAASGMAVVTYTNRMPADDLAAVLTHTARAGASWGIDPSRIGLFAQSGNVPVALSAFIGERAVRPVCAAFSNGFMLDGPGLTAAADAAKAFGFANPVAGRTVDDIDSSAHLLLIRAGRDQFAGLNATIDAFVAGALSRDLPITLINLPEATHGFDLTEDTRTSHDAIRDVVAFMRRHLIP